MYRMLAISVAVIGRGWSRVAEARFGGMGTSFMEDEMAEAQAQTWKATPFAIERRDGKSAGTVIFRLRGPFTHRDMFASMAPVVVDNLLNFQSEPSEKLPTLNILDLTEVPYMDSAGLGLIVSHYVRCQGRGVRLVAAGVSPRVLQLLEMTKVDGFLTRIGTVEEADRES